MTRRTTDDPKTIEEKRRYIGWSVKTFARFARRNQNTVRSYFDRQTLPEGYERWMDEIIDFLKAHRPPIVAARDQDEENHDLGAGPVEAMKYLGWSVAHLADCFEVNENTLNSLFDRHQVPKGYTLWVEAVRRFIDDHPAPDCESIDRKSEPRS